MKKSILLAAVAIYGAAHAHAGDKPQSGTIISEMSVACGEKKNKDTSVEVLCHEYNVRAAAIDYQIR